MGKTAMSQLQKRKETSTHKTNDENVSVVRVVPDGGRGQELDEKNTTGTKNQGRTRPVRCVEKGNNAPKIQTVE